VKERTLVQIGNVKTEGFVDGSRKRNIHPEHAEQYNVHMNY